MCEKPPGWGEDELSKVIEIANYNTKRIEGVKSAIDLCLLNSNPVHCHSIVFPLKQDRLIPLCSLLQSFGLVLINGDILLVSAQVEGVKSTFDLWPLHFIQRFSI